MTKKNARFDAIDVSEHVGSRGALAWLEKDGTGRWVWRRFDTTFGGCYNSKPEARADIVEYGYAPA